MKTEPTLRHILVDMENVQLRLPDLAGLQRGRHLLKIFHGPSQNKLTIELVRALQPLGDAVEYIQCEKAGPNALDFHLAFHLGRLTATQPDVEFQIVSRDKGFAQLVAHANRLGHRVSQHASLVLGEPTGRASHASAPAAEPPPKPAARPAAKKASLKRPASAAPQTDTPEAAAPAARKTARKTVSATASAGAKTPARKAAAKKTADAAPVAQVAEPPVVAKKTPARKAAAKAATSPASPPASLPAKKGAARKTAAAGTAVAPAGKSPRDVADGADRERAIASLRRMGAKRPVKLNALKHHLESHLRNDLSESAVQALVQWLMASGVVENVDNKLTYHLPS